jgi:hypothetical protein
MVLLSSVFVVRANWSADEFVPNAAFSGGSQQLIQVHANAEKRNGELYLGSHGGRTLLMGGNRNYPLSLKR